MPRHLFFKRRFLLVFFNALAFQCLWVAAVFGSMKGWAWMAWVLLGVMLLVQARVSGQWRRDAASMLCAGCLCLLLEPVWMLSDVLAYRQWPIAWLAPHWIWALWLALGLCLHSSLAWLQPRPVLAAAFGAMGGVSSVTLGVDMGAAQAPQGWWPLALIYGGIWALAVPFLAKAAQWQQRFFYRGCDSGERYAR